MYKGQNAITPAQVLIVQGQGKAGPVALKAVGIEGDKEVDFSRREAGQPLLVIVEGGSQGEPGPDVMNIFAHITPIRDRPPKFVFGEMLLKRIGRHLFDHPVFRRVDKGVEVVVEIIPSRLKFRILRGQGEDVAIRRLRDPVIQD